MATVLQRDVLQRYLHRSLLLAVALLAVFTIAATPPASAQGRGGDIYDYSEFHEALDPHGEWIDHPRYGSVWVPYANEDRGWRPYSRGQWIYTDEHGWYWESNEEWGWATYHYGRWRLDDRHGWMWIPGHEWGPAWVAWRHGDEQVGWAPLPPEAEWDTTGQSYAAFDSFNAPRFSPYWIFVAPAFLLAPRVYQHFYPASRNELYFRQTRHVTHYETRNRAVFNRGIDIGLLQRQTGRPVPVLPLRGISHPRDNQWRSGERGHVGVYRPNITSLPPGGAPRVPPHQGSDVRRAPVAPPGGFPGGGGGRGVDPARGANTGANPPPSSRAPNAGRPGPGAPQGGGQRFDPGAQQPNRAAQQPVQTQQPVQRSAPPVQLQPQRPAPPSPPPQPQQRAAPPPQQQPAAQQQHKRPPPPNGQPPRPPQ